MPLFELMCVFVFHFNVCLYIFHFLFCIFILLFIVYLVFLIFTQSTIDPEECSVTAPPVEEVAGAAEEVDIVGMIDKDEQIRQQFSLAWNSLKNVK